MLPVCIHPHVQGPVLTDGEASVRLVHLHGGAASIQQDGVEAARLDVPVRQQGLELTEPAKKRLHTAAE